MSEYDFMIIKMSSMSLILVIICLIMLFPFARCIYRALIASIKYSIELINAPLRKEYSKWDKLWIIPGYFINLFIGSLMIYLKRI